MTPDQEKQACLADGIIRPFPMPPGHIGPMTFDCPFRFVSEGQYQAMEKVWLDAGYKILR